jgi:RHS repeat-associated protein
MIRKVSERRGMGLAAGSLTEQGTVTPGLVTRERLYNYPRQPIRAPDAPTYTEMREWWHRMDPTGRECAEAPDRHCAETTYRVERNANPRRLTVTRPGGTSDVQLTSVDDGLPLQQDLFDSDAVWVEDDLPAGARPQAWEDDWRWVTADPAPFAGARAHQSALAAGMHQHYFEDATAALPVAAGDRLFAYVHLDPANPPEQVMLQWNPGDGTGWEHRAYWGADRIAWGVDGTESRRGMGPLPAAGRWVRLEVAARDVGLEGKRVTGMAFTLFGGRATWDRAGKTAADPLNRLRQVSHDTANVGDRSSPVLPAPTVSFEYVPTGDLTRPSRVTTAGVGAEEFRYDTEGRLASTILTLRARPAHPQATDHLYDGLHRPTGVRYPAEYGITGNPRRLARLDFLAGRPIRLTVDGAAYVGNVDYDAAGQPRSLALPSLRQEYGYDPATGLVSGQRVLRGATRLLDLGYDYLRPATDGGRTGQLTREVNNLDPRKSRGYAYDAWGRLARATGGGDPNSPLWTQRYGYDRFGNRTSVAAAGVTASGAPVPRDGLATLTHDDYSNRIATPGFAHDAAGNLVRGQRADGGWQRYRYDAAGRLAQVLTDAGAAVEAYTYGPDRRRLATAHGASGGERTYRAWAGDTVLAEYRETGGSSTPRWRKSYLHFAGRLLATAGLEGASRVVRHHHPDRLGTRLVTDQAGNVVAEQETLPFGTALAPGSSGASPLFTSYERSAATGLDYAVNRFYDPALGRFASVDPLGLGATNLADPRSTNLYAYVRNDPVNAVDPSGLTDCVLDRLEDEIVPCFTPDGELEIVPGKLPEASPTISMADAQLFLRALAGGAREFERELIGEPSATKDIPNNNKCSEVKQTEALIKFYNRRQEHIRQLANSAHEPLADMIMDPFELSLSFAADAAWDEAYSINLVPEYPWPLNKAFEEGIETVVSTVVPPGIGGPFGTGRKAYRALRPFMEFEAAVSKDYAQYQSSVEGCQ